MTTNFVNLTFRYFYRELSFTKNKKFKMQVKAKIYSVIKTLTFFFTELKEIKAGGPPPSIEELKFSEFFTEIKKKYQLLISSKKTRESTLP